MRYLVDTNILSEMRYAESGNPGVWQWSNSVPIRDLVTSVLCIMEIERGIVAIEHKDPAFHRVLRNWFTATLVPAYEGRVFNVDDAVGYQYARMAPRRTIRDIDVLIAATALAHGLTVVTRNERDFAPLGVSLLNPWSD
jgi:predicted nucleic acid-binding protein